MVYGYFKNNLVATNLYKELRICIPNETILEMCPLFRDSSSTANELRSQNIVRFAILDSFEFKLNFFSFSLTFCK